MSEELQKFYAERDKNQREIEARLIKQKQLENQYDKLLRGQADQERRARTRRLIERGAILESFLPEPETLTNEQVKAILTKWRERCVEN